MQIGQTRISQSIIDKIKLGGTLNYRFVESRDIAFNDFTRRLVITPTFLPYLEQGEEIPFPEAPPHSTLSIYLNDSTTPVYTDDGTHPGGTINTNDIYMGTKVKVVVTPDEYYQANGGGYVQDTGTSVSNTFTVPSYSGLSSTITDNIADFVNEQFGRIPTITPITYQLTVASEKTDGSVTVNYHNGTVSATETVSSNTSKTINVFAGSPNVTLSSTAGSSSYSCQGFAIDDTTKAVFSGTPTNSSAVVKVKDDGGTVTAKFKVEAKRVYFAFIRQDWNNPYPRDTKTGAAAYYDNGELKYIQYKDSGSTSWSGKQYSFSNFRWSGTYYAVFDNDTENPVELSYEGIYELLKPAPSEQNLNPKGKAAPVYSAEIPSGATSVSFYCDDNPNFCSHSTSITEDYVYCADTAEANLWDSEYLSDGKFNLSNDGVLTEKTKYTTP